MIKSNDLCKEIAEEFGQLFSRDGNAYIGKGMVKKLENLLVNLVFQIKQETLGESRVPFTGSMENILYALCNEYEKNHKSDYIIYVGSDILDQLSCGFGNLENGKYIGSFNNHRIEIMENFGVVIMEPELFVNKSAITTAVMAFDQVN